MSEVGIGALYGVTKGSRGGETSSEIQNLISLILSRSSAEYAFVVALYVTQVGFQSIESRYCAAFVRNDYHICSVRAEGEI